MHVLLSVIAQYVKHESHAFIKSQQHAWGGCIYCLLIKHYDENSSGYIQNQIYVNCYVSNTIVQSVKEKLRFTYYNCVAI